MKKSELRKIIREEIIEESATLDAAFAYLDANNTLEVNNPE